ncbi:hypothetical protein JOD50_000381 [Pseudoglutamicibacter cumminsii]|nr:hypothetical protein [Pseudoglutamicibacter cumminsii]
MRFHTPLAHRIVSVIKALSPAINMTGDNAIELFVAAISRER